MDYKQTALTGEAWHRFNHIEINNPCGGTPTIRFDEERRVVLSDGTTIGTPVGAITKEFTDTATEFPLLNPETADPVGQQLTHGFVYAVLWSLSMALAAERDAHIEEPPPEDTRDWLGRD